MLLNLHVKNMALIRELEVDFGKGLNILTGETGAGKSIMIGSINVALGMQSFKGFAREDADSALVELVFSMENHDLKQRIEEMDIPVEDGQVILSRRLLNGRSISKVNGETVPVSVIRELATLLIDIYGQHEHQSLLHSKNHLKILDEYAKEKLESLKSSGSALYSDYVNYKKKIDNALLDEASRKKEVDFLQYEVDEIENASLHIGEDEDLEARYRKMSNARKIATEAAQAYELTSEGSGSASENVSRAVKNLLSVSEYDPDLKQLAGQLADIDSLLSDFNREMSSYLGDLTFDEAEFVQIEERLDTINHLKAKYGNTIEAILSYKEEKEKRLEELLDYDAYLADLTKKYKESEAALRENGAKISAVRKTAAKELAKTIRAQLEDLNFLETDFEIQVTQTDALRADGYDEVCFMISMNPGSPKKPLAEVASGGELSRIMLAIKTVMAQKEDMQTLIFDEIDVGISGRTAQKVSEKMAVIAEAHQVLCITHLAQIASMADHHFLIEKMVQHEETMTTIRPLKEEESIEELARILGGAKITELTMQSAREMTDLANSTKSH